MRTNWTKKMAPFLYGNGALFFYLSIMSVFINISWLLVDIFRYYRQVSSRLRTEQIFTPAGAAPAKSTAKSVKFVNFLYPGNMPSRLQKPQYVVVESVKHTLYSVLLWVSKTFVEGSSPSAPATKHSASCCGGWLALCLF